MLLKEPLKEQSEFRQGVGMSSMPGMPVHDACTVILMI